jgi:hypothetical protein
MPKDRSGRQRERTLSAVLPLFTFTVSIVFSFLYTVIMAYLDVVSADIKLIFIMMLIVSNTAASTVALVFFLFFERRLKIHK